MTPHRRSCRLGMLLAAAALVTAAAGLSSAQAPDDATLIALRHAAQQSLESRNDRPLRLPLVISSSVSSGDVRAEGVGVVEQPFKDMARALAGPEQWCEVLVLHINNKGCRVTSMADGPHIALKVARRYDQPVEHAYDLDFSYLPLASSATLLAVRLEAKTGPMGTSKFVIRLEAAPLGERLTALRLAYAYHQGALTGLAMDIYFATIGTGKAGFSVKTQHPDGKLSFVGGVQGLVERNLMRYYLALAAAAVEPDGSTAAAYRKRLRAWFDASEAYPLQLHEVDQATYLELKRPLGPKV